MTSLGLGTYAAAWAIGVPGFPAPEHPLEAFGFLALAQEHGFRLVQMADNLSLGGLSAAEQARFRAEADRLGIAVEIGARGILPELLQREMALASAFGSPILRVVVDTAAHHPAPDEVVALVRAALPALRERGLTLAIENHDRFPAQTLADIVTAVGDPQVGICLDTVNSFGSREGPAAVVAALGRYVVNLHVKDFRIQRAPHNMGFTITGTPAGQGMLDVPWLLDALRAEGRSFNAILELWPAPELTMAETVAKEAAWIGESVRYLRGLIKD